MPVRLGKKSVASGGIGRSSVLQKLSAENVPKKKITDSLQEKRC
jgi:hypothetical protein